MRAQVFANVIPAGANVNTIRAGSPVLVRAIAVDSDVKPPVNVEVQVIPPYGGSTTQPHLLNEDPIFQLDRSRNPFISRTPASFHEDKMGDFTGVVDSIPVKRLHSSEQQRHRNMHKRLFDTAIIRQGATVELDNQSLTGHHVAARPRVKPWAPIGRTDLPADTHLKSMNGSYLLSQMPMETPGRLDGEEYIARTQGLAVSEAPISERDVLAIVLDKDTKPSTMPPHEDLKTSGGRLLFLVAAVAVAVMVLVRAK